MYTRRLGDIDWGGIATTALTDATNVFTARSSAEVAQANMQAQILAAQQRQQQAALMPNLGAMTVPLLIGGALLVTLLAMRH